MTAKLNVVHLKLPHVSAHLAVPTIAPENCCPQFSCRQLIEPLTV